MATTNSRMVELAAKISKNTEIIDQHLQNNHLPQPSFDKCEAEWDGKFAPEIEAARIAIRDASTELSDLTLGPLQLLLAACVGQRTAMEPLYRFSIPQKIPLDDPNGVSYQDLAKQANVNQKALTKVIRQAIVHHVFKEPSPGRVAHTPASSILVTSDVMMDWIGSACQDVQPAKYYLGDAMERFPEMEEPDRTAASLAFPKQKPNGEEELISWYDHLSREPGRAKRFAGGMAQFQKGEGYSLKHLVNNWDWGSLPEGSTMVDLGGSHGESDLAVAEKYPHLRFVVQDLKDTIASAPKDLPKGVNIEFQVHDFFEEQPVKGARVYFLRWILHNWSDKYAIKILKALRPAMDKDSRILVMDAVVPAFGSIPNETERQVRFMDLSMMSLFNSGDREAEEWEHIFVAAGYKYLGLKKIEGSIMSLMEARLED